MASTSCANNIYQISNVHLIFIFVQLTPNDPVIMGNYLATQTNPNYLRRHLCLEYVWLKCFIKVLLRT